MLIIIIIILYYICHTDIYMYEAQYWLALSKQCPVQLEGNFRGQVEYFAEKYVNEVDCDRVALERARVKISSSNVSASASVDKVKSSFNSQERSRVNQLEGEEEENEKGITTSNNTVSGDMGEEEEVVVKDKEEEDEEEARAARKLRKKLRKKERKRLEKLRLQSEQAK